MAKKAKKNRKNDSLTKAEKKARRKARRQAKAAAKKWDCQRWLVTFRRVRNHKKAA